MQEHKETENDKRRNWVIVDNIPQLTQNKDYSHYATALEETAQHFANNGSKKQPIVYIPHETKKTKHSEELVIDGCAMIQFGSIADANNFVQKFEINPKLRNLNLRCYTWRDVAKYESISDDYQKMSKSEFQNNRNLLWWLCDDEGVESYRDQYVIRFQGPQSEETHIYWNDENEVKEGRKMCYDAQELKDERKDMTRQYVKWSPNGLYLLTTHPSGVQLWGGPNWKSLQKLSHPRVDKMSFSPNEKFLITCNSAGYQNSNGQKINPCIKIFDVLGGEEIIEVPYNTIGPAIKLRLPGWWPIFKWSYDEKYIAKVNSSRKMAAKPKDINKINIFEIREKTEEELEDDDNSSVYKIEKLGNKSITVDSLFDLSFSPRENILAYSSSAINYEQGKLSLLSIPAKNTLKVQTLGFDVKKAHLHWQSQGKYLAIIMGHAPDKGSVKITGFSIGIMTVYMKNYPFSRTDKLGFITAFAWEPSSNRFAVIHNNKTKRDNPDISVYRIGSEYGVRRQFEGSARLTHTFRNKRCNELRWAPSGGRLIIANIDKARRAGGEIEFIDIDKLSQLNQKIDGPTVKQTHEGMTDMEWDPSGRYLITATTQFLGSMSGDDTRYIVWSFQGERLYQHKLKFFYQILWRPRPSMNNELILNKSEKQAAKTKLNQGGWREVFKNYDAKIRRGVQSQTKLKNISKLQYYKKHQLSIKSTSNDILSQRNKILSNSGYSSTWTWTKIKQTITKSQQEWSITKDTMKKILAGEMVDFSNR